LKGSWHPIYIRKEGFNKRQLLAAEQIRKLGELICPERPFLVLRNPSRIVFKDLDEVRLDGSPSIARKALVAPNH
jgi:hypothetical protein